MMIRIWTLSIFTLIISFIFPRDIFAAASITITTSSTTVKALDEFAINIAANTLEPNVSYYLKAIGGDENYDVQTKGTNSSWLNWNTSWSDMPQYLSSGDGTFSTTIQARFKDSTSTGSKSLKVRIRPVNTDETTDSNIISVNVEALPPTPTPSVTPTPSPSPSPTSSPSPSPTKSPTPTPKKTVTPEPVTLGEQEVLGSGVLFTPTPAGYSFAQSSPVAAENSEQGQLGGTPVAAAALMGTGTVFMILAALPFLKKRKAGYNSGADEPSATLTKSSENS